MHFLRFFISEDKPNIIFLHGWGLNHRYMLVFKKYFNKRANLYFLDLPKFGLSTAYNDLSIDDYVEVLHDFVKKNQIASFIGIGHSFGGKVLGFYAKKYPLEKMVLLAPSLTKPSFNIKVFIKIKLYHLLKSFKIKKMPSFLLGSKDYQASNSELRSTFNNIVHAYLSIKELKDISTKTLVIGFEDDKAVSKKQIARIYKHLKNCEYKYLKGDHMAYIVNSLVVVQLIEEFIDDGISN